MAYMSPSFRIRGLAAFVVVHLGCHPFSLTLLPRNGLRDSAGETDERTEEEEEEDEEEKRKSSKRDKYEYKGTRIL
jgi:hypothetical protein